MNNVFKVLFRMVVVILIWMLVGMAVFEYVESVKLASAIGLGMTVVMLVYIFKVELKKLEDY